MLYLTCGFLSVFLSYSLFQEVSAILVNNIDFQEGASHVLSVIHEILAHHRQLESKWHTKKIKLHQRLALRLFQEDVKQVGNTICNQKLSLGSGSKYLFGF